MEFTTVCFILIAVLWTGYFVLEGFDFGVGMLMPVLGRGEKGEVRKRVLLNTIGPVWDGNEVWLLTAGGATFAAFPHWYATMFSGFYLPLLIILVALIVRALGFDYRGKVDNPTWRKRWDIAIFVGSALPALLWGVALTNVVMGLPINAAKEYTGNLFTLLNPVGLLGGLTTVALFPDVMPSSTSAAFSLTATNASSTEYTLTIMTWVAAIFTPIVLLYTSWTYWTFRKRISTHHIPATRAGTPSSSAGTVH